MSRFLFLALFLMPGAELAAEELSGLPRADMAITEPFCVMAGAKHGVAAIPGTLIENQLKGVKPEEYSEKYSDYVRSLKNEALDVTVLGFKKVGKDEVFVKRDSPPVPGYDVYELIERVRLQVAGKVYFDLIVVSEHDTAECNRSPSPLVILTYPEYKVLGQWESWLQWLKHQKDEPQARLYELNPYPNLVH